MKLEYDDRDARSNEVLNIGTVAPNFTAADHDGEQVELSAYTQRYVLLWWFPAAGEPGSLDQTMALVSAIEAFESNGCEILGISFDSVEDNKLFHDTNSLPFRLLSDPEKSAGILYQTTQERLGEYSKFARRISYLIDPDGYIVQSYEVTDPSGHAAEVLTDLKAAQR